MKEMIYKETQSFDILDDDVFEGYHYVIVSYGTHPCAYVEIPKEHQFYECNYKNVDVKVHGGLSYNGELNFVKAHNSGFYYGWDYYHATDYVGSFNRWYPTTYLEGLKKWTTKEMFNDVRSVIKQIKSYEVK